MSIDTFYIAHMSYIQVKKISITRDWRETFSIETYVYIT